jgi:hypothetical protein
MDFVTKAVIIHKGLYDYSLVEYTNSYTKVKIICKEHGVFEQRPDSHLSGNGCKQCSAEKRRSGDFITKAIAVHGCLYDYSLVEYKSVHNKVTIICREHGEFEQFPNNHLRGCGCPKCRIKTSDQFINEAIAIHNGLYDYSLVDYRRSDEGVLIICKLHGPFRQEPNNHLRGYGCPKCAVDRKRFTQFEFVNECTNIYGTKYDYSAVDYVNSQTKIKIGCHTHGVFEVTPNNFLRGYECQFCKNKDKKKGRRISLSEFIEDCRLVHQGKYDYSLITKYTNKSDKLDIICPTHGVFTQTAYIHKSGKGCPRCVHRISKPETKWLDMLGVDIHHRNKYVLLPDGKRYQVDAYNSVTNTVYEFLGDYWHGNPSVFPPTQMNKNAKRTHGELYARTMRKMNLIAQEYNLIYIWEQDWKKMLAETTRRISS